MSEGEILGYAASLLIGMSLGLIGSGGSILTVPIFVYLIGINPVLATAYSLFVVGSTALVGTVPFFRKDLIDVKTAIVFSIPSFIAVFLTRKFLIPAIPETILETSNLTITRDMAIMVFFAIIMVGAAISMIKNKVPEPVSGTKLKFNYPLIAIEGLVIGVLTGLVGAGGGFLIIPALVLFAKLPMKAAVGTSLLIIAAKSLIGFTGDLGHQPIDWGFLMIFTGISIGGIFIGSWLSGKIKGEALKKAFGWFVLAMGIYILAKELVF